MAKVGKAIPLKMRSMMDADPFYHRCARKDALDDHECQANPMTGQMIEWEHAFTYGGPRLNEPWATVPLCWLTHSGPLLNKEVNQWIALNRATEQDFAKYHRTNWVQKRYYLNCKFGKYEPKGVISY